MTTAAQRKEQIKREVNLKRLSEAHLRLLGNSDFRLHLEWLGERRMLQRDKNDGLDGNDLFRGQGRSLEIGDIIDKVDTSGDTLARVRATESQRIRKNRSAH